MKFSIACLIYQSVVWLDFILEQIHRYTDLTDGEFFIVANDATQAVLSHLETRSIPHFRLEHSLTERKEWFINNVYRGYNQAARLSKGQFLVFLNSDMGLSPKWLENLFKYYNESNCVCSRLVESGRMPSGQYGLSKNFGFDCKSYHEKEFLNYITSIGEPRCAPGGLYMPLLIKKEDFLAVGGYPEGNLVPGTDIFKAHYAKPGEPCISGDSVLMKKLATRGIRHFTAFDSIVYHFQRGESVEP